MKPLDVDGIYVAQNEQRETDLFIPFLDFMWKYASRPDIARWLSAIENDVMKLAASLAKIDLFFSVTNTRIIDHAIFVSTEVEYLLSSCRSMFDNLQKVLNLLWQSALLHDDEAQRTKQQQKLPASFSDAAKKIRQRRNGERPYAFPDAFLECYERLDPFFIALRDARGEVVHRGSGVGTIFVLPGGFGTNATNPLTKLGPAHSPDHVFNDNVVALLPILANIVCQTIYACNEFRDAFAATLSFPNPMIVDYNVYFRTPHGPSLLEAQAILKGKTPWRSSSTATCGG